MCYDVDVSLGGIKYMNGEEVVTVCIDKKVVTGGGEYGGNEF